MGSHLFENIMKEKIERSIARVLQWVERHSYRGYEPSDGNLSCLHALTFENGLLERTLQQVVWKSPFDIRALVGVRPHQSTKGMGYMAWGYTLLFRETGYPQYQERALDCFEWLIQNRAPKYKQYCWGDSFAFSSRGGRRPPFEPTIVWSSLIGQAFLDAHATFGNAEYLKVAESICDWILSIPRTETTSGTCLGYTALGPSTIHNSNMLGAALLARVGQMKRDSVALAVATDAIRYSCSRQNEDGSWEYGPGRRWQWIDSFHTGYNLDSLKRYIENTGDKQYQAHLDRGYAYFKNHFIEPDGRPKYYHDTTYPIDIQCASQAIETLAYFSETDVGALSLAQRVANWTIDNMQATDGHFYYRDLGWKRIKTPMFHWGQATMFKALVALLNAQKNLRPTGTTAIPSL